MRVLEIGILGSTRELELPLARVHIPCGTGFPSPADDYIEERLDLNKYLIKHPEATYYARAEGDSMIGAGIFDQDILIVDRSLTDEPNGRVVLVWLDDGFMVKRFYTDERLKRNFLISENPKYPPREIFSEMDCFIWGVVTHNIHSQSCKLSESTMEIIFNLGKCR